MPAHDAAYNAGYILGVLLGMLLMIGLPAIFGYCLARAVSRKTTGWILGVIFSGCATLFFAAFAFTVTFIKYQQLSAQEEEAGISESELLTVPQTVVATDGSCQFTLPAGWSILEDLSPSAEVQARSPALAAYLISLTENKEDLDDWTLEKFSQDKHESLSGDGSTSHSETTDITIEKWPAKQWITRKTVDGVRFVYLCTCISTDTHFYYVLGWTTNSRFNDAKPALSEVVASFQEKPIIPSKK